MKYKVKGKWNRMLIPQDDAHKTMASQLHLAKLKNEGINIQHDSMSQKTGWKVLVYPTSRDMSGV